MLRVGSIWNTLVLVSIYLQPSWFLEIDLLQSFESLHKAAGYPICKYGGGVKCRFERVSVDVKASKEVTDEVMWNLVRYKKLVIILKVRFEDANKGAIIWLQHQETGNPIFGLTIKGGDHAEVTFNFFNTRGPGYVTFDQIGRLPAGQNHLFILSITPLADDKRNITLNINCETEKSDSISVDFAKVPSEGLEFRLSQYAYLQSVKKNWEGNIDKLKLIFNRDPKSYVLGACANKEGLKPIKRGYSSYIPSVSAGSFLNQADGVLDAIAALRKSQEKEVTELLTLRTLMEKIVAEDGLLRRPNKDACSSNPCFVYSPCVNTVEDPGYKCAGCPLGFVGNGIFCHDINECLENPCSPLTTCRNQVPGYHCTPCPMGYYGRVSVGIGKLHAQRNKQVCRDIDECRTKQNDCDQYSRCLNTMGSYKCGQCRKGFVRNQYGKCTPMLQCNDPRLNPCSPHADCSVFAGMRYICKCRLGYAGNGFHCGIDRDLDGFPDSNLECDAPNCNEDNCRNVPNTGQEDTDGDGRGDACDSDLDDDGWYNTVDNCRHRKNPDQSDLDGDGVGNNCDNCMRTTNPDQRDTDNDGQGDKCDRDIDNDGVFNEDDNCPYDSNHAQDDEDKDGIGDECDNCPRMPNKDQKDKDKDGTGDLCDSNVDSDRDGILDEIDNCPAKENAAQLDIDGDGKGDICDSDDDGDGIADHRDNCPLIANYVQIDLDENGIGDVCETDFDGDGIAEVDHCPGNPGIWDTSFTKHEVVLLGPPDRIFSMMPYWEVSKRGLDVRQLKNSVPSLLLGPNVYEGIEFSGTMYSFTTEDDDFMGFVFSYQSPYKFYVVQWKKAKQDYWTGNFTAESGVEIKLIMSLTGPSKEMERALWYSGNTDGQAKLIYKDPKKRGWRNFIPYRWKISHRPLFSQIRLMIWEQDKLIVDSGHIYNTALRGGRVGLFTFSQRKQIWTNMQVICNDKELENDT